MDNLTKTYKYARCKYQLTILLVLLGVNAFSQQNAVKLLTSPRQDSILLRWAPTNSETWRLGNEHGYIVKRYTLLQGKKIPKEIPEIVLTQSPLKPALLAEWENHIDDKFVAIAGDCIFGSTLGDVSVSGNPHLAYKKYKEEKHRFSFALYAADQSLKAATLSGLYFADKTAKEDEKYLYRVFINCPDSLAVDTAYSFTGLSEYSPLPKPIGLQADWQDKKVDLSWNIQYLKHIYNSYFVEKSTDGGVNYSRMGENAIVQLSDKEVSPRYMYKSDSLADNKQTVYYRVKGISAFGEVGPASDSVFGTGVLPLENAPVIVEHEVINNELIRLVWDYPEKMNPYISGFKIYRSPKPHGRKKLVYSGKDPKARFFIDSTPNITNYYLLSVYNERTEKLSPIRTYEERVDSFPPEPPVHFTGRIDTSGKVFLTWNANEDDDLEGYRIYRANNPKFEFMLISPSVINDTVFVDSINLKTLNKEIYYKVKAVDYRQNQSGFSGLLTLTRPDKVPPVAPVIKNVFDVKGLPELAWINSSSNDVAQHKVYRKILGDTITELVTTIEYVQSDTGTYQDKSVGPASEYSYFVIAVDESGNSSKPSNYGYFKTKSDIVEGIKLKKRVYTDQVKLSWSVSSDKTVDRFVIYRGIGEEGLKLYGNASEDEFIDKRVSPEKAYKYAVKAIYTDGTSSVLSNTITVKM